MAIVELKVPSPGESVLEVTISRWLKKDGEYVEKDEEIAEIDSDKATLTLSAAETGMLKIIAQEGDTVKVNTIVATIDTEKSGVKPTVVKKEEKNAVQEPAVVKTDNEIKPNNKPVTADLLATPLAKVIIKENKISSGEIPGSGAGGKITKSDVLQAMSKNFGGQKGFEGSREIRKEKMSVFRKKLAQRLVAVKNTTAMLTTFNEVDMTKIFELRAKYNSQVEKQYGVKLGFMSFFTKAVCEALQLFPAVNGRIEGDEIIYHQYCDIGIAVSAPKGLVVPVLRNAELMSFTDVELKIKELAQKARDNKIEIKDMEGGTFTISNGGVFGSMMSTPILNPPQSGILGMHNIIERPVAINGKVEIRPMMYVALSYDHRIIDGRESVGFLVKVKEMCENPVEVLFGGKNPDEVLFGL